MPWGVAAAVAGSVVTGMMSNSGSGSSGASSSTSAYDPYSQYRPAAAQQLNALMQDPSTAVNSSYGQALQQGASRTMASQGYTGSGNALVASANAGGQAYQQQFNDLVTLSGAGQSPASAQSAANQQANAQQAQTNQMWGQVGNLVTNAVNGGSSSSGGGNMATSWDDEGTFFSI